MTGTISERLKPGARTEKYVLKLASLNGKKTFGKLLVYAPKASARFPCGTMLVYSGEFQPLPKPSAPYEFDYGAHLEKMQVYRQIYLSPQNHRILSQNLNFDYYVEKYRDRLLNSFEMHHFSEQTQNVIKALLLGQRQDMDATISANYTNAGVVHILAISGMHIAILYALLLLFLKPVLHLKRGKLIQFLLIVSFLWIFAVLSGLSASVVRSVVMFSFISFGLYHNKSGNIYNILAVSMLAIVLVNPNFLFDVGFQLSYLAVFFIVWLQPICRKFRVSRFRAVNYLIDTLTVSCAAQIGVLPLSLYYFHQLPLLFLLANLVVIPLSSFALLLGIGVLMLNFALPKAALLLGKLLEFPIEIMNSYIAWVASLENFIVKDIPFSALLLVMSYLSLVAFLIWIFKKQAWQLLFFLSSLLLLQLIYIGTTIRSKQKTELVICNTRKSSVLFQKQPGKIIAFTNDTLPAQTFSGYCRGHFNPVREIRPLKNVLLFKGTKLLVIDQQGIYKVGQRPDIVLLSHSPRINLRRMINELHPKKIIADASNYKSRVAQWQATCRYEKIPFHATAEKGFYTVEE